MDNSSNYSGNQNWVWIVIIVIVIIIIIIICWSFSSSNRCACNRCSGKSSCNRCSGKKSCKCADKNRNHKRRNGMMSGMNEMIDGMMGGMNGLVDEMVGGMDGSSTDGTLALLELTGEGITFLDKPAAQVLNLKKQKGSNITIKDTQSNNEQTKMLLEQGYQAGYRKFIAGTRSSVLRELLPFINSKDDAVLISLGSTVESLAQKDNAFRMVRSDSNLIPSIPDFLKKRHNHIHIFQSADDVWAAEHTARFIQSLRPDITVSVTMVNDQFTEQDLSRELYMKLPKGADIGYLSLISTMIPQFYEMVVDNSLATMFPHYGLDNLAFFPFEGKAAQGAMAANLVALSYTPDSTPQSEELRNELSKSGQTAIHPYSIIACDAANALDSLDDNVSATQLKSNLDMTWGVTGYLGTNNNGDRVDGNYVFYRYTPGNAQEWQHENIFGDDLRLGRFMGMF